MESSSTSLTLLEALREASNEGAWKTFDDRYRPLVVEFARQLGANAGDAEEAAQRTMVGVWAACQQAAFDREKGRFKNWLLGIARHKLADLCAERDRQALSPSQRSSVEAVLTHARDPESLSAIWEHQWIEHVLRLCLDEARKQFAPRDMCIFERLAVADEPPDQVAAAMHVSINVVYKVKHHVLAHMRRISRDLEEAI